MSKEFKDINNDVQPPEFLREIDGRYPNTPKELNEWFKQRHPYMDERYSERSFCIEAREWLRFRRELIHRLSGGFREESNIKIESS